MTKFTGKARSPDIQTDVHIVFVDLATVSTLVKPSYLIGMSSMGQRSLQTRIENKVVKLLEFQTNSREEPVAF